MCEQVNNLRVRMSRHFLPLLLSGFILQLQCLTGHAQQYVEPYQSQSGVSTSFVNTPVSSINPYSQLSSGVQTVDQNTYIQPYSSSINSGIPSGLSSGLGSTYSTGLGSTYSSGIGSTYSSGIGSGLSSGGLTSGTSQISYVPAQQQQQQQQVISGGQSSFFRQQPSVTYFTVTPEARSLPTSQQISQPNFIYRTQGQHPQTVDSSVYTQNVDTSSVPVQREFVYPVEVPQVHSSPQFQFPSNVFSQAQPSSQAASNEKFIPFPNLRPTLSGDSKVITLGDNPFVITSIKPKQQPSVQVVSSSKKNPLESLRTEAIIEAILNAGKNDASRSNQIVVTTKSDVGRVPVTEAMPQVFSTTPVTEIFSESSPASLLTVSPTEQTVSTTTPMPTTTTTTTTTPPPPPVHFEVTTTEERHFVSRKKKITIFIRVEDAGYDAEEKENYSTKQDFHEWTKTIIEPTDIFEEKKTFVKNETREVDGPSLGVDVTKVICRNFVDDKETVVELDALEEKAVCPRPVFDEGGSWEERAFHRVDSEVERKLKDIFSFPRNVGHTFSSQGSFVTSLPVSHTVEPISSGFLRHSLEAIQNLSPNLPERHPDPVPVKRDTPKTKQTENPRLIENQDLVAEASEVELATDSTVYHDDVGKTTPYMTSKREAKPEVVEEVTKDDVKTEEMKKEDVKKDDVKVEEIKREVSKTDAGAVVTTPQSHIMLITRTPPVRPPSPYHHSTTLLPPVTEEAVTKTDAESLPVPQALSSSVEKVSTPKEKVLSHTEENSARTFFRRST